MALLNRQISNSIRLHIDKYPILAITGPRQSGKTTLLRHILPEYRYISLENTDQRSFAEEDPVGFLKEYNSHVIFDEIQRVPHLFSYIQTLVDESKGNGTIRSFWFPKFSSFRKNYTESGRKSRNF